MTANRNALPFCSHWKTVGLLSTILLRINLIRKPSLHLALAIASTALVTTMLRFVFTNGAINQIVLASVNPIKIASLELAYAIAGRAVIAPQCGFR